MSICLSNNLFWRIFEYCFCLDRNLNAPLAISLKWGLLAKQHGDRILVWDLFAHQELWQLEGHYGGARTMILLRDEETLVTGGQDGTVKMWNLLNGEKLATFEFGQRIEAVAISADARILATSDFKTILILNLKTNQIYTLAEMDWGDACYVLALSPNGEMLVSGNFRDLTVWSVLNREILYKNEHHGSGSDSWTQVFCGFDGKTFYKSDRENIEVKELLTGDLVRSVQRHYKQTYKPLIFLDGRIFMSVNEEKHIKIWNFTTDETWFVMDRDRGKDATIDILCNGQKLFKGKMLCPS